ncbi:MAG: hypothetical protein ABL868_09300 [Sulfuriferula sp.]
MNHTDYLDKAADYINNNLSPEERAEFDAFLQGNADARQELKNLELLREVLDHRAQQETGAAWDKMRIRLDAEEKQPISLLSLWRRWRMRLSLLGAIGVAVIEAMLLVNAPAYRAMPVDTHIQQVQVVFAPDAQQGQIRELLDQVHAQIIAGPGPSGEYTLSLPADEVDAAMTALRAAPLVQDAYPSRTNP